MTYKYFSKDELKCRCERCVSTGDEMDNQMMIMLNMLREQLGFPFHVTSAYRCPEFNSKVSRTGKKGRHTTGKAIDINVCDEQAIILLSAAKQIGFKGFGVNQKGSRDSRFIHLDTCTASDGFPDTNIWTY
jgi:uncharacterized protein YcbK (DUF882 family)